jgi:hypothetical protein
MHLAPLPENPGKLRERRRSSPCFYREPPAIAVPGHVSEDFETLKMYLPFDIVA